jgi:hypothetical protein
MMGPTHREWGAISSAVLAAAFGNDPANVLICAFIGWQCATWPDKIERVLPWIFRKHRGMSHSWEINVLVMLLAYFLPPMIDYPLWGLALAWNSHLTGDFVFGLAGHGRGAGIPMFLGTKHVGFGVLKVNGWTENGVKMLLSTFKYGIVAAAIVGSALHTMGAM